MFEGPYVQRFKLTSYSSIIKGGLGPSRELRNVKSQIMIFAKKEKEEMSTFSCRGESLILMVGEWHDLLGLIDWSWHRLVTWQDGWSWQCHLHHLRTIVVHANHYLSHDINKCGMVVQQCFEALLHRILFTLICYYFTWLIFIPWCLMLHASYFLHIFELICFRRKHHCTLIHIPYYDILSFSFYLVFMFNLVVFISDSSFILTITSFFNTW